MSKCVYLYPLPPEPRSTSSCPALPGHLRAPSWAPTGSLCHAAASHQLCILQVVVYIRQHCCLNVSHPVLPALCPRVQPLCLRRELCSLRWSVISYQISDTVIRVEAQRKWVSESGRYLGERFQVEKIESSKVLRIVCVYYAGGTAWRQMFLKQNDWRKEWKWGQREGQKANHKELDWQQGGLKSLLEIKLVLLESFEQRNNMIWPIF